MNELFKEFLPTAQLLLNCNRHIFQKESSPKNGMMTPCMLLWQALPNATLL